MEKKKVEDLFSFLSKVYPKAKEFSDKDNVLAWSYVLEPFDYKTIRAKASAWARNHDYPPRVSELTAGLSAPAGEEPNQSGRKAHQGMEKYCEEIDAEFERKGGACHLLRDYHGTVGEIINEHYPDDCGECRRREISGCPYAFMKR